MSAHVVVGDRDEGAGDEGERERRDATLDVRLFIAGHEEWRGGEGGGEGESGRSIW